MKERLTRNIGTKIISLLIAILIWVVINGLIDPIETKTFRDLPVQLLNEEAMASVNKIFEVTSGETISIRVRGKRSVLQNLQASEFEAFADITNKTELNAVEILVNCTTHGEDEVEIIEKKTSDGTSMMKLSLEDSDTQSFAVSIVPDGAVAEGYYITESIASPNLITISGSKTQIAKIAKIAVLVDVNGTSESFERVSTPVVYDKNGNVVDSVKLTMSAEQVQVAVTLLPTKVIDINVAATGTAFYDYTCSGIEYAPHTITIAGEEAELQKINSLQMYCDISNARSDVEVDLNLEEALAEQYGDTYIIVDETDRVSVKASIEKMTVKEISILTSSIELRNLQEDLEAEFQNQTMIIRVVGIAEYLESITASVLRPYVDCSVYTAEGTYTAVLRTADLENVQTRATTVELVLRTKEDMPGEPEPQTEGGQE